MKNRRFIHLFLGSIYLIYHFLNNRWFNDQIDLLWDMIGEIVEYNDGIYRILLQCEAPKIAKLVYNSNNYGLRYL